MFDVEIYTPSGVLVGTTDHVPLSADAPDLPGPLAVAVGRWYPVDGSQPTQRGDVSVDPDDILLIVTPEPELKVHMAWYSIAVDVGPYRVFGRLATHPGFDPGRALLRPGSVFVALGDATIELGGRGDAGSAQRPYLHVNRYAVDRVTSTLMLGHFFPGARLVAQESATVATGLPQSGF
ncbi:MAG: hypothetical protein ABI620_02185 [Chloroflexota bacterium]